MERCYWLSSAATVATHLVTMTELHRDSWINRVLDYIDQTEALNKYQLTLHTPLMLCNSCLMLFVLEVNMGYHFGKADEAW